VSGWPPDDDETLVGTPGEDDSLAQVFISPPSRRWGGMIHGADRLVSAMVGVASATAVLAVQVLASGTFRVNPGLLIAVFSGFTCGLVFDRFGFTPLLRLLVVQVTAIGFIFSSPLVSYAGLSVVYIQAALTRGTLVPPVAEGGHR
jgi:hypothetical protein